MPSDTQVFAGLPVRDLAAALDWYAAGLRHEPVETYDNGVRHVTIIDPDGDSVSLAEAPTQS